MMRIVADENIPYVREAFSALGDVTTMSGRAMDAGAVRDADVLLVRSITKVNGGLLDGSRVRFVATATIGEEHVDKAYLVDRGIGFASAPGSNANSVAEYLVSALLVLSERGLVDLRSARLGIVGVGNVGSRVLKKAAALGVTCVLNDPPLERETGDSVYRPLDEILECNVVTLHVPLTSDGPDATYHLVDKSFVERMRPGAILVNTSRGAVADGAALAAGLDSGHLGTCVLDVWQGEPDVDIKLLKRVAIGTPHIAGYSFDGKVNGTRQIYEAACGFFDQPCEWNPFPLLPQPECPQVRVSGAFGTADEELRKAVFSVYDVGRDDAAMRRLLDVPAEARPGLFDQLRKTYPRRREFFNTTALIEPPNPQLEAQLSGIGFNCKAS